MARATDAPGRSFAPLGMEGRAWGAAWQTDEPPGHGGLHPREILGLFTTDGSMN